MYQCLNGAIPARKCSIKAFAKWKTAKYVYYPGQRSAIKGSKWLGPCLKKNLQNWIHSHINFCSIESKSQNEYCWIVWWHCDICLSTQFPLIKLAKFNWRKVSGNDRVLWGKTVVVNENQVSYISLHFILGFFSRLRNKVTRKFEFWFCNNIGWKGKFVIFVNPGIPAWSIWI